MNLTLWDVKWWWMQPATHDRNASVCFLPYPGGTVSNSQPWLVPSRAPMCHPAYSCGHLPFWLVSVHVASAWLMAPDTAAPRAPRCGEHWASHLCGAHTKPADTLTYSFGFSVNVRLQLFACSAQTPPDGPRRQITLSEGNIKETNMYTAEHSDRGRCGV